MCRVRLFEWQLGLGLARKARQVNSKVKSMLIIFFDIKEIIHKNSSWQAKQSVLHTNVELSGAS
jgi:hypothetical protein